MPYLNKFNMIIFLSALAFLISPGSIYSQEMIPDDVLDVFDARCAFAGCHAGANPQKGLDLTEDFAMASLVNRPSKGNKSLMLVQPQDPARSYLIRKLKGMGITGDRMPNGGDPLSRTEIAAIENWINSLPAGMARMEMPEREYAQAFPGISLATLPSTQTIEKGMFSYRIAHRWRGAVTEGFDKFFGLDFGAHMLTQLAFPISNGLMVSVSRSAENATFEFSGKWRFLREKTDGSMPISAAILAGVDWATATGIASSERFAWFGQLALSKQIHEKFSVVLVPGILLNGNTALADEDPLLTLGFGAKFMMLEDFSIFVEGAPILSGEAGAATVGGPNSSDNKLTIYDSFTIGLERKVGGHVFHVYITNSLGLTTGQYMSGGNFDFTERDFRLGFNIYRTMRLPF